MSNILKKFLVKELEEVIEKIEEDSCDITPEEMEELLEAIAKIPMSREQASKFMGMSLSSFDKHIASGDIPQGQKRTGFKEKVWYKCDLEKLIIKKNGI